VTATTTEPDNRSSTTHRNEVLLAGEITDAPSLRTLADGRDVVTFRIDVRVDTDTGVIRDSFDCTADNPRTRKSALGWAVGDVVEVEGVVRRKFYRSGAASRPFTVIEASRAKRLSRA
jgi:single-strand DNA-binding protein